MPFMILCGVIAFIVQIVVLYSCKRYRRMRWILPLAGMELLPACLAANAIVTKKPDGVLGWRFTVAVSGWMALAILLGCAAAWIIFSIYPKGEDEW